MAMKCAVEQDCPQSTHKPDPVPSGPVPCGTRLLRCPKADDYCRYRYNFFGKPQYCGCPVAMGTFCVD